MLNIFPLNIKYWYKLQNGLIRHFISDIHNIIRFLEGITLEDKAILFQKIEVGILNILEKNIKIQIEEDLSLQGLDSLKMVQLIVWIEEEFEIVIDDEDLLFENFENILKISGIVSRYISP